MIPPEGSSNLRNWRCQKQWKYCAFAGWLSDCKLQSVCKLIVPQYHKSIVPIIESDMYLHSNKSMLRILNFWWQVSSIMPVHYSTDLRWRAVWLKTLRNMSFRDVGEQLFLSEKSVRRYVEQFYTTGHVDPTKQKHGPQLLLNDFEQILLIQLLIDNPSMYLNEIQTKLFNATGTDVHESTLCRTIHHLGFTRKKIEHIAFQRSEDLRVHVSHICI